MQNLLPIVMLYCPENKLSDCQPTEAKGGIFSKKAKNKLHHANSAGWTGIGAVGGAAIALHGAANFAMDGAVDDVLKGGDKCRK